MSTIYEVAAKAKVSTATVSRVFNGAKVSAERRKAVLEAAKDLNFVPNRTARSLRRQESELIALIIPDIENPFFTELARGVEDVAQDAGYSVVLCNSDSQPEKESRYLRVALSERMAGVILASTTVPQGIDAVMSAGHPVVAVDRSIQHDVDAVVMDNDGAGREATRLLQKAGYRRIACITGRREVKTATERAAGWQRAVEGTLTSEDAESLLRHTSFRVSGGRKAIVDLLALPNPPDAVVACNNLLGVGALQVLIERDIFPPAFGVAVIGSLPFSTIPEGRIGVVRLPARHMGVTAAKILLARINGDSQPARTIVLRPESESVPMSGLSAVSFVTGGAVS